MKCMIWIIKFDQELNMGLFSELGQQTLIHNGLSFILKLKLNLDI